jgi:SAM-dependent methyltransferase
VGESEPLAAGYIDGMQWFEDDRFWQTFYPRMFDGRKFEAAAGEVDRVLALSGVTEGAVLDLCCGPGRHSLPLAQKGFAVTGVDRSPFLLAKARERMAGERVELIEADMREFVRERAFDLALSLFTSFGYFDTRGEDLAVLRNIRTSLKAGGTFVIDVISKEYLASRFCATHWDEWESGEIYVQHYDALPGWDRLRLRWLLISGDRAQRFEFTHQIYSGHEMMALLEQAGFQDIQLFGSLDGTPYDSTATRLVALARAPR